MMQRTSPENGNVFFYIFLAIALFGSLSFAVSQGSRGSVQNLSNEQSRLRATEIIGYADAVTNSVGTLRLRGTSLSQLSFANTDSNLYGTPGTSPINEVFNTQGGGAIYQKPPIDGVTDSVFRYNFVSGNSVVGIGKTCTDSSCSDLLLILSGVKKEVCLQINKLLGVENTAGDPPVNDDLNENAHFTGTTSYTVTVGDEAGSLALNGKASGCFLVADEGQYSFYKVLWLQ